MEHFEKWEINPVALLIIALPVLFFAGSIFLLPFAFAPTPFFILLEFAPEKIRIASTVFGTLIVFYSFYSLGVFVAKKNDYWISKKWICFAIFLILSTAYNMFAGILWVMNYGF